MRIALALATTLTMLLAAAPVAQAGAVSGEGGSSCAYSEPDRPVRLTQGAPPPELVDALGVLRRPRTSLDLLPDYGQEMDIASLHLRYVRRTPGGLGADRHYVVTGNLRPLPARPPRRCLRGLSARARREFVRGWREAARQPTDVLCLAEYESNGRPMRDHCAPDPVRNLRDGLVTGLERTRGRITHVSGIVPDGVARVEARYERGPSRFADVVDNVWSLNDLRRGDRLEPETLVWLDPAGAAVKTLRFESVAFGGW